MYSHTRNHGCRISDEYTYRGLRLLALENEALRVSVLLDKGSDIWEFLYKPLDIEFMWRSPLPVRSAQATWLTAYGDSGPFLDLYHGGWQECFPTGGPKSDHLGASLGIHGEIAMLPWDCRIVENTPDCVAAELSVRCVRTPFLVEKTLKLQGDTPELVLEERITNEGAVEAPYMWGHHPAFGPPLLSPACRVDLPAGKCITFGADDPSTQRLQDDVEFDWPVGPARDGGEVDLSAVEPPESESNEVVIVSELSGGWYGLTDQERQVGFGMWWDVELFPYIWYWQVCHGIRGYPWHGRTYNIALEPWTSYPNAGLEAAIENGSARTLGPGESVETTLGACVYTGVERVSSLGPGAAARP